MKRLTCVLAFLAAANAPLSAQDYSPPPANRPSAEALKEIAAKTARLEERLASLRKQGVNDNVFVDLEVYLRGAEAIVRHNEFFSKDSTAWTLEALDRGLLAPRLLSGGETPWLFTAGQTVARGYRSPVDNSVQPFAVSYPHDFGKDPKRRWRVDVVLHGRDTSLTEVKFLHANNGDRAVPKEQDWVQINIFGRGNNAYRWAGETDVLGRWPPMSTWRSWPTASSCSMRIASCCVASRWAGRAPGTSGCTCRTSGAASGRAPASRPRTGTSPSCPTRCRRIRRSACASTTRWTMR